MTEEILKCEECGKKLKQSGSYAHGIREDGSVYNGKMEINYWCVNVECDQEYKNIKIFI